MSNQEVGQVTFATFGATGVVGGRVAARLAEAGVRQRLVVRDRSRVSNYCQLRAPRSATNPRQSSPLQQNFLFRSDLMFTDFILRTLLS